MKATSKSTSKSTSKKASVQTSAVQSKKARTRRIGFPELAFLVISGMVGGGVFMMPAQMANPEADGTPLVGPGAEMIAWLLTALGIWFMVCTFRLLTDMRPDLKAGMFSYAHTGFGKLVGFLVAWGYWLFNTVSCAAYGMLVMSTLHYFFPSVFTSSNGNSLVAILCASSISWFMVFLASRGAKESATLNIMGTIAKGIPILTFIIVCLVLFNPQIFTADFWALHANQEAMQATQSAVQATQQTLQAATSAQATAIQTTATSAITLTPLNAVMAQIGPCTMVTLWVFLGVEGAVVASGEAKSQKDVSRATLFGFLVTLGIYLLVSLLPFGLYTPAQLGHFSSPSMGTIMADKFGTPALIFINIGIIVSVLSSWLVWVVLCTQMPLYAARKNLLPSALAKQNKQGAPVRALLCTGAVAQISLIASFFVNGNVWDMITNIISAMAAPCYLFCALFLLKISLSKDEWKKNQSAQAVRWRSIAVGICATTFGVFLILAGNIRYLLVACIIYAIGIPIFVFSRYRHDGSLTVLKRDFHAAEWISMLVIFVLGVVGACLLCSGAIA